MSKSKNDFPLAGGTARLTFHPHRGQYDAIYTLIDPQTHCPYTYGRLAEDLTQRKQDYPYLAELIDKSKYNSIMAKAADQPETVFSLYKQGKTKEEARAQLEKEQLPKLRSLARLLHQPLYELNLKCGNITVEDFVTYQSKALYMDKPSDTRTRLMGYLKRIILPRIGEIKLKNLDKKQQEKAVKAINKALRKEQSRSTKYVYVRQAYRGLLQAIEGSGWMGCAPGMRLADLIGASQERNTGLLKSVRVSHLDNKQRAELFRLLYQPERLFELFLAALIYSGMEPEEIAAATFYDFEKLNMRDGSCCYTLLVCRRVRKLNQRYSTVCAANENFDITKFRKIVLPGWAGDILLRRLEQLRDGGLTNDQIYGMRLSDETHGSNITGPEEIAARLLPLMKQAKIDDPMATRMGKDGRAYRQTVPMGIKILQGDARYLAERCGADAIMVHAMFGDSWSETDEQAYLDLLSDEYAIARYLRLRRWSPLAPALLPDAGKGYLTGFSHTPAHHVVRVENPTNHPVELTLSAPYAIKAYWASDPDQERRAPQ